MISLASRIVSRWRLFGVLEYGVQSRVGVSRKIHGPYMAVAPLWQIPLQRLVERHEAPLRGKRKDTGFSSQVAASLPRTFVAAQLDVINNAKGASRSVHGLAPS